MNVRGSNAISLPPTSRFLESACRQIGRSRVGALHDESVTVDSRFFSVLRFWGLWALVLVSEVVQ